MSKPGHCILHKEGDWWIVTLSASGVYKEIYAESMIDAFCKGRRMAKAMGVDAKPILWEVFNGQA